VVLVLAVAFRWPSLAAFGLFWGYLTFAIVNFLSAKFKYSSETATTEEEQITTHSTP